MAKRVDVTETYTCDMCGVVRESRDLTPFWKQRQDQVSPYHMPNVYMLQKDVCVECMSRPLTDLEALF